MRSYKPKPIDNSDIKPDNNSKPKIKSTTKYVTIKTDTNDNNDDIEQKKDGYKRPKETFTDRLSKKQIADLLVDYEKVTDLSTVPIGTHIRYITKIKGVSHFRMGGNLIITTGLPEYVILSNGSLKWSVQTKDTVFFRKINIDQIKDEYEKEIWKLNRIIKNLVMEIKDLKTELNKIKKT